MNRRSPGLQLSKALVGFLQYKAAEGLSPNTLRNYKDHLTCWLNYAGEDTEVSQVTSQDLRAYLAWLRTDYKPRRLTGGDQPLAPKTIRNVWATLCSFFAWASVEFDLANPMKAVPAPRFERPPVETFSKEDIQALLKAYKFSREANTTDRRRFTMRRPTARRDQAIILTLLDTGLRASELCSLKVGDVDQKTGRVHVKHGRSGGAKFGKGRVVFLGKAARRALWRYLAEREDGEDPDAPLFTGRYDRPLNKNALRLLITRLGEKAKVKKCHPHRFRHTFAITYLRAGGDLFTLQALLGHSSLEMVQYYARIAEIDVQQAHRRASPADNWRL
ncbi:MAG: tyrosine-type recombinase/integrase [Chloroflexota bacterium]|nr:tyrosine-type recombinase/integrase [Chloroflexota bacterium]